MRNATTLKRRGPVRAGFWSTFAPAVLFIVPIGGYAQLSGPPAGVPVPSVAAPAPAIKAAAAPVPADAKVFRVRLLDGRNGAPLASAHLRLWYDESGPGGYTLTTSSNGTALMPEPIGTPLRILLQPEDKIDCRSFHAGDPAPAYNLQQIAEQGVVLQNGCGPVSAKPHPGEVVFFVRSPRWYEGINRP